MGLEGASHLGKFLTVREAGNGALVWGPGAGEEPGLWRPVEGGSGSRCLHMPNSVRCRVLLLVPECFFLLMPKSKKYFGSLVLCASAL